jgi:two-component system, OmpR family, sensor histidine kinase CiaH
MLIIFLFLINFVIGVLLFINMYHEQRMELFDIAQQEINELKIDPDGYFNNKDIDTRRINRTKGIFLTYFITNNNKLRAIDDFSSDLHNSIMKKVGNWKPKRMSERYVEVNYPKNQPTYLLIVAQNIYIDGHQKGTIYIGKDVKFLRDMIIHFLFILIGLSLIFFIVALFVGQFMTKRAMEPILKSYTSQSKFIADASHELRTPLSVLKSGLDVLEFEEGNKLSSVSKNVLSDLKEEINGTTQLVTNLLFLIRSESGQQTSEMTSFDLRELIQQTLRSFMHLSESKMIKLDLLTKSPLMVYTDKEKVKQLLYLLVDNALKYTPPGGQVSLSYGLKSNTQKRKFFIAVRDNGVGIPLEEQEKIFDRFYRVDKSRSRQNGSSGLGLSIGKSIVESLNGTIEVTSVINKGSEFSFTIPFSKA